MNVVTGKLEGFANPGILVPFITKVYETSNSNLLKMNSLTTEIIRPATS